MTIVRRMDLKSTVIKRTAAAALLMILVMAAAFGFRLFSHRQVVRTMGQEYMDPETGLPFLTEMDSYYHLRMTRDIMDRGVPGGEYKDNEAWDTLSYAPYGRSAADYKPLMAYIAIASKKILSRFAEVTLEKVVYWQGAVLSVLVVIPVFIMAYRLGGFITALVSSVLACINYGYFVHTIPGFYDTDTILSTVSCLFFLSAVLLASAFEKKTFFKSALLFFLASLCLLIMSWNAYALFVGVLTVSLVIYAVLVKRNTAGSFKRVLTLALGMIGLIFLSILIFDRSFFANMFSQATSVFAGGRGIFPDALVSVSEMKKPVIIAGGFTGLFQMKVLSGTAIGVVNAVGGAIPCISAAVMCIMLIRDIVKKKFRFDHILLAVWYFAAFVLAFRSWRFIMLFAVPVALLSGLFAGWLIGLMREKRMMDYKVYAAMILLLMMFPTLYGAYRSAGDSHPSVNMSFYDSMKKIKLDSDRDTILASWWDYGYFFEEKAQRRTIFDGGSQNGMRVYWIGKALSCADEDLSYNIIRMLSGEGDKATEEMIKAFGETKETLFLMTRLLSGTKEEARAGLEEKGVSVTDSERIVSLLFPEADEEVLCLISRDMYSIAQWFYTLGTWGEEGVDTSDYSMTMKPTEVDPVRGQAVWRYNPKGEPFNLMLTPENGSFEAHIDAVNVGASVPAVDRVVVKNGADIREIPMEKPSESDGEWVVYLEKNGDRTMMTVMTAGLYDSVFGRLYFRNGAGLEHFVPSRYGGSFVTVFEMK